MATRDPSNRKVLDALDSILAFSIACFIAYIYYIPLRIIARLFETLGVVLIFIAVFSSVWALYSLSTGKYHPAISIAICVGSIVVIVFCYRFKFDSKSIVDPRTSELANRIEFALLRRLGHSKAPPMIHLRPINSSDLPIFFEHQQHQPAQHMAAFIHEDPSDRAAFDAHWSKLMGSDKVLKRSIEHDRQLVGHIMSFDMPNDEDGLDREITYWIGHEHWGKGIASQSLRAFLEIETTRPLFGRAALDNAPSIRTMEKNGFRLLRNERGFANARGEEIDEVVMLLI